MTLVQISSKQIVESFLMSLQTIDFHLLIFWRYKWAFLVQFIGYGLARRTANSKASPPAPRSVPVDLIWKVLWAVPCTVPILTVNRVDAILHVYFQGVVSLLLLFALEQIYARRIGRAIGNHLMGNLVIANVLLNFLVIIVPFFYF